MQFPWTTGIYARRKHLSLEARTLDNILWDQLPLHNQFITERIKSLCLDVYSENQKLIGSSGIPNWSQQEWNDRCGTNLASNVIITHHNFHNKPHIDKKDTNTFTYGLFCYINAATGEPLSPPSGIENHGLKFLDYNALINFTLCDGILEMLWRTKDLTHQTILPSTASVLPPSFSQSITHFGCSFQINQDLFNQALTLNNTPIHELKTCIIGKKTRGY